MKYPVRTALVLALLTGTASTVRAQDSEPDAWTKKKCVLYERVWYKATAFIGLDGVSQDFIKGNEQFIAAGCSNGADVCPHSPQEIKLAHALTVAAMNFGTASSFLPFVCRQR